MRIQNTEVEIMPANLCVNKYDKFFEVEINILYEASLARVSQFAGKWMDGWPTRRHLVICIEEETCRPRFRSPSSAFASAICLRNAVVVQSVHREHHLPMPGKRRGEILQGIRQDSGCRP